MILVTFKYGMIIQVTFYKLVEWIEGWNDGRKDGMTDGGME